MAVVVAVVMTATACTTSTVDLNIEPEPEVEPEPVDESAPAEAEVAAPVDPGRLAILRPDGTLVTVDSEGESQDVVAVPDGAPPLAVTWSGGGERLAWSQVDDDGPHIRVSDGSNLSDRIAMPFVSFFLMWDRQGADIAALGNGGEGTALVTVSNNSASEIVTSGSPLYLSWAPDGGQLAARRSDEVGVVDLGGGISSLTGDPAAFATSTWLPDGRVVFSLVDGEDTIVSVRTPGGDDSEVVFRSDGPVQVVADDTGRKLAVASFAPFGQGGSPDSDLIPASFSADAETALQTDEVAGPGLYQVNLDTGAISFILDDPGVWWSWSPNGDRLLVLRPSRSRGQASWTLWNGSDVEVVVETFAPTPNFIRSYVPFAAQWDQAIDLWAPDGQSFAFAGVDTGGDRRIFVHEIESGRLTDIGPGYFVTWSPAG